MTKRPQRIAYALILCAFLILSTVPMSAAATQLTEPEVAIDDGTINEDQRFRATDKAATTSASVQSSRRSMTAYEQSYTDRSLNHSSDTSKVTQRWESQTGSAVRSSPTLTDDTAYVGSTDGNLYAYDADTGREKWRVATGGAVRSAPVVVNGTVYASSANDSVYAVDATTGAIKWTVETQSPMYGSPVVTSDTVYTGSFEGLLYALHTVNGTERWNTSTQGAITGAPAIADGRIFVGQYDGTVAAFDAETGTRDWQVSTGGRITSAPTVAGGKVYTGSTDSRVYALDSQTGSLNWEFVTGGAVYGSVTVSNGRVFAPSNDNNLYAINANTGRQVWNFSTNAGLLAAPTVTDDSVYVGGTDDQLRALSVSDGSEQLSVNLGSSIRSKPAVSGDAIYVGTESGQIYALTNEATKTGQGIQFVTNQNKIFVNQTIQLYANEIQVNSSIQRWEWSFGDNITAEGKRVAHSFDQPGTYTITLIGQTSSGQQYNVSKELQVTDDKPTQYDLSVEPVLYGVPTDSATIPEGVGVNLSYRATVSQPNRTENVTFGIGNQTYTDVNGRDGWQYPVQTSKIEGNTEVTVTATRADGTQAVAGRSLNTIDTPAWFREFSISDQLNHQPVIVLETTVPEGGNTGNVTIPDRFPFSSDVEMPAVGSGQSSQTEIVVRIRLNLRTAESTVTVSGSQEYNISSATQISGEVSGTGYFLVNEMDITDGRAQADLSAETTVPATGVPSPPVGPVPPGAVRLYPVFGAEVPATAYFDEPAGAPKSTVPALVLTNGTVQPNLYARQEVGQKWEAFKIIIGLEEGIQATVPFEAAPINGSVYGQLFAETEVFTLTRRVSYPSGADRFEYDFSTATSNRTSAVNSDTTGLAPNDSGWTVQSKTGAVPPTEATANVATDGVRTNRLTTPNRITRNQVADQDPAITSDGSTATIVWSRQDVDKSAINGRDIYVATDTGSGFTTRRRLTDDNISDFSPDISNGHSGGKLVSFMTLNRSFDPANVSGPEEMYTHSEIRLVRFNGTTQTNIEYLTTNNAFDYNPQVVAHDDGWTVAWTSDSDGNMSSWRDRSVYYVGISENGSVGQIQSITRARSPRLTTGPTNRPRLVVLKMEDAQDSGTITSYSLTQSGTRTEETAISVTQLTGIAAANETIAWTTEADTTWVNTVSNETKRTLKAPENASEPQSISLTARDSRVLLNFRTVTRGQSVAQAYYQPRINGKWLDPRQYANGSSNNVTYWQTASTGTNSGFKSVAAGKVLGTTQKHDLFAFQSTFRPELNVTITNTSTAPVGDNATVAYTVSNDGDANSSRVPISVNTSNTKSVTRTVPALSPGERVQQTAVVTVGSSGQLVIQADPNDTVAEHTESTNRATATLRRPDLAVSPLELVANETSVTVLATVTNPTNVTAASVSYRLSNGPSNTRTGTTRTIQPGQESQYNWSFERQKLDTSYPVQFQVDPSNSLRETTESNNIRTRQLLQANIKLCPDTINYYRTDNNTTASITVENRGLAPASGMITVTRAETGAVVANDTYTAAGANSTTSPRFSTTDVQLQDVSPNETLRVTARTNKAGNDTAETRTSVIDTVRLNTTLRPPAGQINANQSVFTTDHPIQLTATNVSDDDGTVTAYDWAVTNATLTGSGQSVVILPDTNATSVTTVLELTDNDGLLVRREVTLNKSVSPELIKNARLETTKTNVEVPSRVTLGTPTSVSRINDIIVTRADGETVYSESNVSARESITLQWEPTESTWNASKGQYEQTELLITAVASGQNTTIQSTTTVYIAGDVTGDGKVNILDAVQLGRSFGDQSTAEQPLGADLNNDGAVNIVDAAVLGRNWQTKASNATAKAN